MVERQIHFAIYSQEPIDLLKMQRVFPVPKVP